MTDKEKITALENELKAKEGEVKALRKKSPNDHTGTIIPGEFTAELVNEEGKNIKKKVAFQPGFIKVRLKGGQAVSSAAIMKLANGKKLTEEEASDPNLNGMDKEKASAFLTDLVAKGASYLKEVGAVLALLLIFSISLSAQLGSGRLNYFDQDTLTNTDTLILNLGRNATDMDVYDFVWQVAGTSLSGTDSVIVVIEESLFRTGDYWHPVDTATIAASTSAISWITGTLSGVRQRAVIRSAGTQSTQINAAVRYRRRDF